MQPFTTADLCDTRADVIDVVAPGFADFGGARAFGGPIATVRVSDDNVLIRAALQEPGVGRILVVDGGASRTCALLGDRLAALGLANGWAGTIVNGCVRDVEALASIPFGVRALGSHPRKSGKQGLGTRDEPVTFAGVTFRSGGFVYADADGIVWSDRQLV